MVTLRLSRKNDWVKYWRNKKLIKKVPRKYYYRDFIDNAIKHLKPGSKCIEIGGFPGYFSIYFKKFHKFNPVLIDYYIDKKIFFEILKFNGLKAQDIKYIEGDVFLSAPDKKYDLVYSMGFIEHFDNLRDTLLTHLKYLKPGGILLISLPNFRGVNGLLQRIFDPEMLSIHNLKIMDLTILKSTIDDLGLIDSDVVFYPSTQVWLEDLKSRGIFVNILLRIIDKFIFICGQIFGSKNKYLSNTIILRARSPL
jgi:SAM-dependent methyltransferase